MIFLRLIAIIKIVLISSFFLNKFCNLKNLNQDIKNYFNSIIDLKNLLTKKNNCSKNKILEKKLNKVSFNGLILLFTLLKIIFPYTLVFYLINLFEFNISFVMTSIFALLPYIGLFKK